MIEHENSSDRWVPFLLLHIPLGYLLRDARLLVTVHALIVLGAGVALVLLRRQPRNIAYILAYIAGSEVLWRMNGALLPWEFSKYATILLCFLAFLTQFRKARIPTAATAYFVLLLPSVALTLMRVDAATARELVSFNLSGPLSLMAACWFFWNLTLRPGEVQRLLIILMGPIIAIATKTFASTFMSLAIRFTNSSNFDVTGGFGPNQVSSILGWGALLAFYAFTREEGRRMKPLLLGVLFLFVIQSAMTFSRGGLYAGLGAAALASIFLMRDAMARNRILKFVPVVFLIAAQFLFQGLNDYTNGALSRRFSNTGVSYRDVLIQADLQTWADHPLAGVGPGVGKFYRDFGWGPIEAHTEFSRMLAEHGILGLASMLLLGIAVLQTFRRAQTPIGKAIAVSFFAWAVLYMLTAAMRLVAPAFAFGLAMLQMSSQKRLVRIWTQAPLAPKNHLRAVGTCES